MSKFWRKYHKWVSIVITVPFLITLITGLLLLFRGQIEWISPKAAKTSGVLTIDFPEILKAAQNYPEAKVESWNDISRVQVDPGKGHIVVRSKNSPLELQIDGGTGEVIKAAERNSSLLVQLHEGTFWTKDYGRFVIGTPMTLAVLFLTISGVVLFFQPQLLRRNARSKAAALTAAATRSSQRVSPLSSSSSAQAESELRGN